MFSLLIRNIILNEFKQSKQLSNRNLFKSKLSVQHCFGLDKRRLCDNSGDDKVNVHYILKDGTRRTIEATVGQNVMEVAQENDIDIEGACAASLACCTCHVYVKQEYFDKLDEICDLEEDMLDQGCQIILTKELNNIEVELPAVTRNFYVDGHKPSHH